MRIIIVPENIGAQMTATKSSIEICSLDGHVLGQFTPADKPKKYDFNEPEMTQEEFDARMAEGGGRKLADILRDLEARG